MDVASYEARTDYVKRSNCKSMAHGLSWYSIYPVFVVGSKLTSIRGKSVSEFIDY